MTAFVELGQTLAAMGFLQLVLALAFLASYSLTLTGLPDKAAERWAIAGAWLSAAGFAAATTPWVHGVMLIVAAVGAMGLFIAAVWALNRAFGQRPDEARPHGGSDGALPLPATPPRAVPPREVAQTAY